MIELAPLHTFGFTVKARGLHEILCPEDIRRISFGDMPFQLLGGGSNTVFTEDYDGNIVLMKLKGIDIKETSTDYLVTVAAGENWHQLVSFLVSREIDGLENMALIPGTVGAAPVQNIGAYGKEFKEYCESVSCFNMLTNNMEVLTNGECEFSYRHSIFKEKLSKSHIITSVTLRLPKQWHVRSDYGDLKSLKGNITAEQIYHKVIEIRSKKLPDPSEIGNAGSFFKNPTVTLSHYEKLQKEWPTIPAYQLDSTKVKIPAAWLIDTLNYKGKRMGGILCHQNQPLVLANEGAGTGSQLIEFAQKIIADVKAHFFIELVNEVRLVGREGLITL